MGVRFRGYGAGALGDGVVVWGMGIWHGLASGGLCRLGFLGCALEASSVGSGARTSRFNAAFLASSGGIDAGEERVEIVWDLEIVEEELAWGIAAS
jgi:hypothetical protein